MTLTTRATAMLVRGRLRLALAVAGGGLAPRAPVAAMGLRFPNPVGLAAGADKDGGIGVRAGGCGFGFVEVGTLTACPEGINPGVAAFAAQQERRAAAPHADTILGVSIGLNTGTPLAQAARDLRHCLRCVAPLADYVCINLTSRAARPLHEARHGEALHEIIAALAQERERLSGALGRRLPLAVKFALPAGAQPLPPTAYWAMACGCDGLVAVTAAGPAPADPCASLRALSEAAGPDAAIISVGGIRTVRHALERLGAGARLVQLYGAIATRGPGLARAIAAGAACALTA
ncbi:MAG: hypothetical protein ACOZCP_21500 [Pseudomonadota bacterium]